MAQYLSQEAENWNIFFMSGLSLSRQFKFWTNIVVFSNNLCVNIKIFFLVFKSESQGS